MKNTILILISLLFLTGCEKEVSSLQDRNGVKYEVNSKVPFTGRLVMVSPNGHKLIEGSYKNGKEEGIHTAWYDNGQKEREGNHKDGMKEGLHIGWHSNGQEWSEGNYKDGKEEGIHTAWYDNGQKWSEGNYKDEKEDGIHTEWYDNGQKEREGNFKNGKKEGLWTTWWENGQKEREWNYKDGKLEGLRTEWNENGQKVSETTYKDGVLVFKEKVVVKDDNSDLTSYAHVHCNTLIQEKYGSDHTISMPHKPLNVWDIGDDDYVVNGEVNVSDNGASIDQKYVCRIKFDDGDPNVIYNWSLYDISGLADLDEALRRRTLYSVE
jgi:antitoxin component YwqK of YwqJK toxin-antitoxin module